MLAGHLDALLTSGLVEGWALDRDRPDRPVHVSIVSAGNVIAQGLACRYRRDLAASSLGWGWNAFRLPLSVRPAAAPHRPVLDLVLTNAGDRHPLWQGPVRWIEDVRHRHTSVENLIAHDPTQIRDPQMFEGLRDHLARLCAVLGAEAFIRRCYLAIFGRPADASGLAGYMAQLQAGDIQPYDAIAAMMRSGEFIMSNRGIPPPILASFPFALPASEAS